MDLSINRFQKTRQKQISFDGVKSTYSKTASPVFNFTIPPYDSSKEEPFLELVLLNKKDKSSGYDASSVAGFFSLPFDEEGQVIIRKEFFDKKYINAFAYRYRFDQKDGSDSRYANDEFKAIEIDELGKLNLIDLGRNYGISPKAGTMRHSFVDSDAVIIDGKVRENIMSEFRRNHFNKLGGSLKGIDELIKSGELAPYRYIITTPDIGVDPTSPHKYWSNNLYQCNNLQDFKDLNFDLYKLGKAYVADGAFTSQGIQSPLVAHVLKWGKESPFYNMLKIQDNLTPGVLPAMPQEGKEYPFPTLGIRVVNPKKPGYNKNKPTYIQFYDSRMASDKQINDASKLILSYDKAPKKDFEVIGYPDSVHPFYFEVDPDDDRLKIFTDKNAVLIEDFKDVKRFLSFDNFKISDRQHASGATFWDGNVDLIKMNLSNPRNTKENIEGMMNARKYILGVASYWTETIQSDLILRTALLSNEEKAKVAKNNDITPEQFEIIKNNPDSLPSAVLSSNKTVSDYIKEFPLQSLEVSPELTAVFSEPQFKEEFLNEETFAWLNDVVENTITEAIPEEYKQDEKYKAFAIKTYANDVIRDVLINSLNPVAVRNNLEKVTLNSLLTTRPVSVKDERNQVVRKMQRLLSTDSIYSIRKKVAGELSKISYEDFRQAEAIVTEGKAGLNWRFDAAKDIADLDAVRNGSSTLHEVWDEDGSLPSVADFWADFIKNVKKYNPAALTILEITDFASFYEWNNVESMRNFAPDITNDFLDKTAKSFDKIAEKAKQIDKEGFKAAAEILRTGVITEKTRKAVLDIADRYYDKDETRADYVKDSGKPDVNRTKVLNLYSNIVSKAGFSADYYPADYENHVAYVKEQQFLEQVGATTGSNYDKYFNRLSMFAGVNPENYEGVSDKAGNVSFLREQTKHLMKYGQPHTVMYSHVFYENHDKPRLLHVLPLDTKLFLTKNLAGASDEYKKLATEITGRKDYYEINPKAVAVAQVMKREIEKEYGDKPEIKNKLLDVLKDLANGVVQKGDEPDYRTAEAFGVAPYEDTIQMLFNRAGINDKDAMLDFHKGMLGESMDMQQSLWQVINALVGTPTLYNGAEFAQTGYETPSKNVYVGNRGEILHGLKNDERYSTYYNKMQAISSLYKNPQLRALREGYPVSLVVDNKDGLDMWPLMKYDERGSKVISVITGNRLPKGKESKEGADNNEVHLVDSIKIKDEKQMSALPEGTTLRRKIYNPQTASYVDDNVVYTVENGEIHSPKGKIKVDDTVMTFYVPNLELEKHKFASVCNGAR